MLTGRSPLTLFAILLVVCPPLPTAHGKTAKSGPLQREIDALVQQLDSVADRGGNERSGPTRVEGIAWESSDGQAFGTSALGAYLDQRVGESYSRRHPVTPLEDAVGQRGLFGTLLGGAFRPLSDGIRLTLKLIDSASGQTLSEASKVLATDLFPAKVLQGIQPPDPDNLRSLGSLVEQTIGEAGSAFGLRVSTDRGKHAAYAEGEPVSVFVESERDCYVRLYHISWKEKRMTLIFPNRYARDDFVEGGVIRRIPSDPRAFAFEAAPPYGVDAIVAVASEAPFPDDAQVASGWDRENGAEEGDTGLEDEGGYLVGRGIDAGRLEDVLRRGLVIRPGQDVAPSRENALTSEGSGGLARASCYFATVKNLF